MTYTNMISLYMTCVYIYMHATNIKLLQGVEKIHLGCGALQDLVDVQGLGLLVRFTINWWQFGLDKSWFTVECLVFPWFSEKPQKTQRIVCLCVATCCNWALHWKQAVDISILRKPASWLVAVCERSENRGCGGVVAEREWNLAVPLCLAPENGAFCRVMYH